MRRISFKFWYIFIGISALLSAFAVGNTIKYRAYNERQLPFFLVTTIVLFPTTLLLAYYDGKKSTQTH